MGLSTSVFRARCRHLTDSRSGLRGATHPNILTVLYRVVDERLGVNGANTLGPFLAVIHHQMNMCGVGKADRSHDLTGLDDLTDLHHGVFAMAVANMLTLLERTDRFEHLHLNDTVAASLESWIARC